MGGVLPGPPYSPHPNPHTVLFVETRIYLNLYQINSAAEVVFLRSVAGVPSRNSENGASYGVVREKGLEAIIHGEIRLEKFTLKLFLV